MIWNPFKKTTKYDNLFTDELFLTDSETINDNSTVF